MNIVSSGQIAALRTTAAEMRRHLEKGVIPFWASRARDIEQGGYLTRFDGDGCSRGTPVKYLNTQCRLLWWFSTLARAGRDISIHLALARHGFAFIRDHFWDQTFGGWFWQVRDDGTPVDPAKVLYGQSFALYALAEYALATGDREAEKLAEQTFELVQARAADLERGGYWENLERDWSPTATGSDGGDRKTLDTHMHLMEAFTVFYELTQKPGHRQKLMEVIDLICERMIDPTNGSGRNQFDLAWNPIPALALRRTWNAERNGEMTAAPLDTTSYGHNVELAWLMRRALMTAGVDPAPWSATLRGLVDHALAHGVDWDHGGLFREGLATSGPLVLEKEFWQNAEALVGFLDAYLATGDEASLQGCLRVWAFARKHFIAPCGEWRVLLGRTGGIIDGDVGNDWKVSYHTGRAMLECVTRLGRTEGLCA